MIVTQSLVMVIASLGAIQALFLAAYLISLKQGRRAANVLLAMVLIGLSIRVGKSIFNHYLVIEPWQRNIGLAGLLLSGPAFYLYGKALLDQFDRSSYKTIGHFTPALIYVAFCWLIPNHRDLASNLSYVLVMLHFGGYLMLANHLRRHQMRIRLVADAVRWYEVIGLGLFIIWSCYALIYIGWLPYYLGGAIAYSVLVYGLALLMLNRQHFVTEKYRQTGQKLGQSRAIVSDIETVFKQHQLYLDPTLTVGSLARHLELSARQVSQAINDQRQQSFSEFVKRYRVEHAKSLLADGDHSRSKIAVIAMESGFGNVTSFNLAFKALVDATPSEYRNFHR